MTGVPQRITVADALSAAAWQDPRIVLRRLGAHLTPRSGP